MPKRRFFHIKTHLDVPAEEVFRWHTRPGAFGRLVPPWEKVEVLSYDGVRDGAVAVLLAHMAPGVAAKWIAYHCDCIEGKQFRDVQLSGPFLHWSHLHRFPSTSGDFSYVEDQVEYILPLGTFGNLIAGRMTRDKLVRMFRYRHEVTRQDLLMHCKYKGVGPMKVLISGSSGLIGNSLGSLLSTGGHTVKRLVRRPPKSEDEVQWDPNEGQLDASALKGVDAVVHLSGESIAGGRWTAKKKQRIVDSRIHSTRLLSDAMASLEQPPKVLLSASAIGFYGSRGEEALDEESDSGSGFLADVCRQWEQSAQSAQDAGIRTAHLRFGVVLSPAGGALATMLLPFKMGAGGIVGSGRQYMSWVALDDAVGAVHHALMNEDVAGPINVVAPQPVTNYQFTKTLGKVLRRPTIFPMPAFAVRIVFGEMGEELLLSSARVTPKKLQATDYEFRYPHLEEALRHLLGATTK